MHEIERLHQSFLDATLGTLDDVAEGDAVQIQWRLHLRRMQEYGPITTRRLGVIDTVSVVFVEEDVSTVKNDSYDTYLSLRWGTMSVATASNVGQSEQHHRRDVPTRTACTDARDARTWAMACSSARRHSGILCFAGSQPRIWCLRCTC